MRDDAEARPLDLVGWRWKLVVALTRVATFGLHGRRGDGDRRGPDQASPKLLEAACLVGGLTVPRASTPNERVDRASDRIGRSEHRQVPGAREQVEGSSQRLRRSASGGNRV